MGKMVPNGSLMRKTSIILISVMSLLACNPNKRTPAFVELVPAPSFNEDSAYHFIEQQIEFGYRIPGIDGHRKCGNFIVAKLKAYGFVVSEQIDSVVGYDSIRFPLRNIIGKWNQAAPERILLCAHWDSRPFADQDSERPNEPIVGANDNASGVAVLLEIARNMAVQSPSVGVDVVFFDLEDQGRPAFDTEADPNDHGYCLGSKYWAEHFVGTKPKYGVLLDMVGAKDATFNLEHYSWKHAKDVQLAIWDLGHQLGYASFFSHNITQMVLDDHVSINELAGIPTVDIIHQDVQESDRFWESWHTQSDNLSAIDRKTLRSVGQTVTQFLYLNR
ncbi:MAG: hypothetical protein RL266_1713 [Bacteroidota bacterium]